LSAAIVDEEKNKIIQKLKKMLSLIFFKQRIKESVMIFAWY
jgi:hypothetical protein